MSLYYCLFLLIAGTAAQVNPIVRIATGLVQGEIDQTIYSSKKYASFRGIPYGKPPTGYRRFMAAEEAVPWSGVLKATSEATPCPQIDSVTYLYIGDEDCLNLNVYTPKTEFEDTETQELLPVIVWFSAGGFTFGYSNKSFHGPDLLIDDGVVVVTLNHRLGPLGFLSLNLANATGNAGLKDQRLALQWVQRNIKAFGGDPRRVTISGLSSGGVSVDYHVLAPASKDLFNASISMSGSPLCVWGFSSADQAKSRALTLAQKLGIKANNLTALLEQLYLVPARDLMTVADEMYEFDPPFKPTKENKILAGPSAFLTQCPLELFNEIDSQSKPHLTGYVANEALNYVRGPLELIKSIQDSFSVNNSLPEPFYTFIHEVTKVMNETSQQFKDDFEKRASELLFFFGIDSKVSSLIEKGVPVFYYINEFSPNTTSLHNIIKNLTMPGAVHADDLAYIWHMDVYNLTTNQSHPFVIKQKEISRIWTNFAKTMPTEGLNFELQGKSLKWEKYDVRHRKMLVIGNELSVQQRKYDLTSSLMKIVYDGILPGIFKCN